MFPQAATANTQTYLLAGSKATMGTALISLANLALAAGTADVLIPEAKGSVRVYGP